MTEGAKNRITYIDLAKGIGIIMVVWAHANGPYRNYIYQMHMPFFFLISGYLYNNRSGSGEFIRKRFQSLYVPFVFWNILSHTTKSLLHHIRLRSILIYDKNILLTLERDGQFFGASWFLAALFLVECVYKLLDHFMKEMKYRDLVLLLLFSLLSAAGFLHTFKYMFSRTLILSMFYAAGVSVRRHQDLLSKYDHWITAAAAGLLFLVIGRSGSANMGANQYSSPVLFVIGSFAASYALMYLCRKADTFLAGPLPKLKEMIIYLGRNSKDILIWQFIAFRIVILIQMILNHETISMKNLLSYYPLYSAGNGWWIAYLAVGLMVPLAFCSVLRKSEIIRKLHIL